MSCLEADDIRSRAWRLVEEALPHLESRLSYEWSQVVEQLAKYNLGRAARLFGQTLLSEVGTLERQGRKQLSNLVSQNPEAVMEGLGQALLDPIQGWRLQVRVLRDLLSSIPPQSILVWVREHGIEAARAIARHLPGPYLDNEGHPIVPDVLDVILREYDDDQVFMNFSAGGRSGVSWSGDESEQFRRETDEVKRFLKHANRRVREWARHEIENRTRMADWQEREQAEQALA